MVAIYARVNNQTESGEDAMDRQIERMRRCCKSQGWDVAEVYSDFGKGTNLDRPSLQRMIDDAKTGKFDKVLVYRTDRLSRSFIDMIELYKIFSAVDVDIISMDKDLMM